MKLFLSVLAFTCLQLTCRAQEEELMFENTEVSILDSDYDTPQLEVEIEEPLYDYVEVQNCIPEVEAVLQDDGSYVYEEVKSCPPDSQLPIDYDAAENTEEPQLEVEQPEIDIVEEQDCIPELEAVLQDDGSYLYEEVKSCPPTDSEAIDGDTAVDGDTVVEPEPTNAESGKMKKEKSHKNSSPRFKPKTKKKTNLRRKH